MIVFFGSILVCYLSLILFFCYGFSKIKLFSGQHSEPKISFSIVVPYRNEEKNLPALLQSLQSLNYPIGLFEIILVNDASEDTSEEICQKFKTLHQHLNLKLSTSEQKTKSPKKDALKTGISNARNKYILTTDADCIVPENWLLEFSGFISETGAKLVAGSVKAPSSSPKGGGKSSLLEIFQELDFLSLQAVTMGGFGLKKPFLCNGANICYEKKSFFEVGGFSGNEHISSGDDIFLLEKFEKAGFESGFLKSLGAIVSTSPQPDLKSLLSQRIRWAAKATFYKNNFGKFVGVLVLLVNLEIVFLIFLCLFGYIDFLVLLVFLLLKFGVDFLLLHPVLKYYHRENLQKHYLWSCFLYPFFSSFVAVISLFKGFSWKGRTFNK